MALLRLAEEDPTFKTYTDQETGQTIIAGMGELHLEIIVDRIQREFKVEASVGAPQVSYREAITKVVPRAEGRFVRQSGGHGQYGHCIVEFTPPGSPARGYVLRERHRWWLYPEGIHRAYQPGYSGSREERHPGRL